jgi:hypothetical protein
MNAEQSGAGTLNVIVIILAVVGALAILSVGGMALMHGTMMGRMGGMGC